MRSKSNLILLLTIILISSLFISADHFQDTEAGDVEMGAQLYYSWDWFLKYDPNLGKQPLWGTNELSDIETWRCVSCHGWDYSGILEFEVPGVLSALKMPNEEILEWLDGTKNTNHDFSNFFTVTALRDITAFLHLGIMDYSEILFDGEIISSKVDRPFGEELYKAECSSCHSVDGAKINFGSAANPIFVGDVGYDTPEKMLHIVRFGHLEINTKSAEDLEWSLMDSLSLVGYTEVLPLGQGAGAALLESVDYSTQGETTEIVYLAFSIVLIPFMAVAIFHYRNKKRKNSE